MYRGVFWLIENKLHCFPFDGSITEGFAKSGNTYNHQKLWDHIHPENSRKDFDYYPRGRVEITAKGRAVIFMSPHIGAEYIPQLKKQFGLSTEPIIKYDHSSHYKCFLDEKEQTTLENEITTDKAKGANHV